MLLTFLPDHWGNTPLLQSFLIIVSSRLASSCNVPLPQPCLNVPLPQPKPAYRKPANHAEDLVAAYAKAYPYLCPYCCPYICPYCCPHLSAN